VALWATSNNQAGQTQSTNEWCRGFLRLTQEAAQAFSKPLEIRPLTDHWYLFGDDDDLKNKNQSAKRDRVHNMLTKLFIMAMGYEGKFFDYGIGLFQSFPRSLACLARCNAKVSKHLLRLSLCGTLNILAAALVPVLPQGGADNQFNERALNVAV